MERVVPTDDFASFEEAATTKGQCLAIVQNCLSEVAAKVERARKKDDPEAIHQLRVAVRRLRAALGILRKCSPSDELSAINAHLRDFQQALGAAREWDVLIDQTIASMPKRMRFTRRMRRLIKVAEAQRADGHQRARAALKSRKQAGFVLRLESQIGDLSRTDSGQTGTLADRGTAAGSEPFAAFAAKVLNGRHRNARKLGKMLTQLDAEGLHALRISIKKLRYAVQFFSDIWPGRRTDRYLAGLADLQQVLGTAHDASVAIDLAGRLETAEDKNMSRAVDAVRDWAAKCFARDQKRLVRRWKKFDDRKRFWKSG